MATKPKRWIDRNGNKIDISALSDSYLDNIVFKLENEIADKHVPLAIKAYANMLNKGSKWAIKTSLKYNVSRLKMVKTERKNRLSAKQVAPF